MADSITQPNTQVKQRGILRQTIAWIDAHPRTGWYVAVMVTLNLLVNLVNLFS